MPKKETPKRKYTGVAATRYTSSSGAAGKAGGVTKGKAVKTPSQRLKKK